MKLKIVYKNIELQLEYDKHDTFTYQLEAVKDLITTTLKEYNNYEK
jgi:hypothetical protein